MKPSMLLLISLQLGKSLHFETRGQLCAQQGWGLSNGEDLLFVSPFYNSGQSQSQLLVLLRQAILLLLLLLFVGGHGGSVVLDDVVCLVSRRLLFAFVFVAAAWEATYRVRVKI